MSALSYDQAQVLVSSVYRALDLFAGSESELSLWARSMDSDGLASGLMPEWFDNAERAALTRALLDCGVVRDDTTVDRYRMLEFQRAVEFLPHFRSQELARRPAPKPQLVFTVPPEVDLPLDDRHVRQSLAARVQEALSSAEERALLASPYWSDQGADILWDATARIRQLCLPVTLAGAKRDLDSAYDHLAAMTRFGRRLADAGCQVTCLQFNPPTPSAIFHAKLVCGAVGYLGSGNLTDAALTAHVEAGMPLAPVDVERAWWLIHQLHDAGLLSDVG
jgi:hypothetical protein